MKRIVLVIVALATAACHPQDDTTARELTGGVPERGRAAIQRYGCGSCHTVPGVDGASGLVGPPLSGIGSRTYLAGHLPNTPDNMKRWIMDPQKVDDKTVMPDMNVNDRDARDISAYLYTLRVGS